MGLVWGWENTLIECVKKRWKESNSYDFSRPTRCIARCKEEERNSNTAKLKSCGCTDCFRRNLPLLGRKLLKLIYIHITKHTHIRTWTFTEIIAREKMRSSCGSIHCNWLAWCVNRTLRKSVLKPIAKPSHAEANALCKGLGNLGTTVIKLVPVFLT
jgi:hypothetical protein